MVGERIVQHLNPMPHRNTRAALQMRDTAYVGADDDIRTWQGVQFSVAQGVGNVGIEHRLRTRRATAQMRFKL